MARIWSCSPSMSFGTAQRGVETGGVFVLFSCSVVFKLFEYCDISRLWMKQAWARDSPVCAATQVQAGWLMNRGSIPVRRKKLAPRPIHLVDKAAEASWRCQFTSFLCKTKSTWLFIYIYVHTHTLTHFSVYARTWMARRVTTSKHRDERKFY